MNLPLRRRQRLSQELIPPLLIAVLGTVGVIGLYLARPGFRPLDLILLLLIVGFGALGYKQRIVRGIMLKGSGLVDLFGDVWPLLAFMLAAITIALMRYRRTLD